MKRIIAMIMALGLAVGMTGCGSADGSSADPISVGSVKIEVLSSTEEAADAEETASTEEAADAASAEEAEESTEAADAASTEEAAAAAGTDDAVSPTALEDDAGQKKTVHASLDDAEGINVSNITFEWALSWVEWRYMYGYMNVYTGAMSYYDEYYGMTYNSIFAYACAELVETERKEDVAECLTVESSSDDSSYATVTLVKRFRGYATLTVNAYYNGTLCGTGEESVYAPYYNGTSPVIEIVYLASGSAQYEADLEFLREEYDIENDLDLGFLWYYDYQGYYVDWYAYTSKEGFFASGIDEDRCDVMIILDERGAILNNATEFLYDIWDYNMQYPISAEWGSIEIDTQFFAVDKVEYASDWEEDMGDYGITANYLTSEENWWSGYDVCDGVENWVGERTEGMGEDISLYTVYSDWTWDSGWAVSPAAQLAKNWGLTMQQYSDLYYMLKNFEYEDFELEETYFDRTIWFVETADTFLKIVDFLTEYYNIDPQECGSLFDWIKNADHHIYFVVGYEGEAEQEAMENEKFDESEEFMTVLFKYETYFDAVLSFEEGGFVYLFEPATSEVVMSLSVSE